MADKARGCIRASDRRVQSMRVEQAGTAVPAAVIDRRDRPLVDCRPAGE